MLASSLSDLIPHDILVKLANGLLFLVLLRLAIGGTRRGW